MTSSPPDISTLSLSHRPSQQRLHDSYDYDGNGSSRPQYHYATSQGLPQSPYTPLAGMNQSPLKNKSVRAGLPAQWLDNTSPDNRSLSPHNNSDFSSAGGSPPMGHLNPPPIATGQQQSTASGPAGDEDIIPTAIVIKNIPFNVKRETLLDIITSLSIPTPYAFNYHLDQQGQFRGLAFANFRQAADADAVVAALNGFDVQGRKLRVEYKKVLQAGEKERIEREKAIRRMRSMQLEKEQAAAQQQQQQTQQSKNVYEDYGTAINTGFGQRSFSSGAAYQQSSQYSPPPVSSMPTPSFSMPMPSAPSAATQAPNTPSISEKAFSELDLNDPSTLEIYSRILLFKDDPMRDELAFSRTLTPKQRRIVHLIAQKLGVYHYSVGEGDERYAVVTRIDPNRQQATASLRQPHTLSRTPSAYLTPTSAAQHGHASLRVKKSMPDLKTLHSQAPRLTSRASNGNIREGYATISSPSRRVSTGFGSLFSNGAFGGGSSVPPVPSLPASLNTASLNGGGHSESPGGVVRQPRGPTAVGGFSRRDSRVGASESQLPSRGGLEIGTHEPLEI
ncbi:RRM/R3H domain-containing protein [Coprinopsis cinerea okayama7|uniref:RRM/R3H domain-containing protein n=1 Tax=Coprinopsis cinerea (strain Okayama-7 / 130 / ATCC MYA-4618 / FGSC 9003) TaxID=240176 RepID=A8NG56_COPC7|nr:RRM/R3H domain-containing protein [Coprinopsis cinerea okayama7\|eukprot:XP_001833481.1 RRM/R3H domain-containing protein [Coprinopsis cinerea okayama7\